LSAASGSLRPVEERSKVIERRPLPRRRAPRPRTRPPRSRRPPWLAGNLPPAVAAKDATQLRPSGRDRIMPGMLHKTRQICAAALLRERQRLLQDLNAPDFATLLRRAVFWTYFVSAWPPSMTPSGGRRCTPWSSCCSWWASGWSGGGRFNTRLVSGAPGVSGRSANPLSTPGAGRYHYCCVMPRRLGELNDLLMICYSANFEP
jgi:hypothetical protein